MTRLFRSIPRHALTLLRSDLGRDFAALCVIGLFLIMIIVWSVTVADHFTIRRYA